MKPLDPRLALAFGAHRTRVWRVLAARVLSVALLLAVALFLRHWATWVLFAIVAFTQGGGAVLLLFVSRIPARLRARLENDVSELAWFHSAPDPRSKLHQLELHDRAGGMATLFVPAGVAKGAIEAARELGHAPTITTNAEEHAAAEPRHRLAAKLVELETAALATKAPRLAKQAPVATAAITALREHLFRAAAHPYRAEREAGRADIMARGSAALGALPDLEARIDKLLHLYASARLGEGHRVKMEAIVRDKNLPEGLFAAEYFTDEIAAELVALRSLAEVR